MTPISAQISLNGSRLVRFLSDMNVSDVKVSHQYFAERLGDVIDINESIRLSSAHSSLSTTRFNPREVVTEQVIEEFFQLRTAIVQSIVNSLSPDTAVSRIKLPAVSGPEQAYEPYLRFYQAHQRDIDFKVQGYRSTLRTTVAGRSEKLAQLAALDLALENTLLDHNRKLFVVVPRLLGKRYEYLWQQHEKTLATQKHDDDDGQSSSRNTLWLDTFYADIQGLLLAELDVRLQPVLGLIEALNEEVDKNQ
ncbi:MAG: DUF3348 family protein [Pseudomonadales bacterium]